MTFARPYSRNEKCDQNQERNDDQHSKAKVAGRRVATGAIYLIICVVLCIVYVRVVLTIKTTPTIRDATIRTVNRVAVEGVVAIAVVCVCFDEAVTLSVQAITFEAIPHL